MEIPNELKDFRNFVYVAWDHLGLPEPPLYSTIYLNIYRTVHGGRLFLRTVV